MAIIITLSNHKGGVGKTTSTFNIGAGLHKLGKKVLLVDLDPQASLTTSAGIKQIESSMYDYLKSTKKIAPISLEVGFDILPASSDLTFAEVELSAETGREYILQEAIEPLTAAYDYILIDSPPSIGLLTMNALTASNKVLIPLQAHYLAMKGVGKLVDVINTLKKRINRNLVIGGVFVTQYDKRKLLHHDVLENAKSHFGKLVFNTQIRDNIALAEAPATGKDIFKYDPTSNGAKDYLALCQEIINQE
jgi:chromosome partitioning protein